MRKGLKPDKHEQMLDLLSKGHSIQSVSDWFDVDIAYVVQHFRENFNPDYKPIDYDSLQPKSVGKTTNMDDDPYSDMDDDELLDVNLKDFREFVKQTYKPDLHHTSTKLQTIKAYREGKDLYNQACDKLDEVS